MDMNHVYVVDRATNYSLKIVNLSKDIVIIRCLKYVNVLFVLVV